MQQIYRSAAGLLSASTAGSKGAAWQYRGEEIKEENGTKERQK